MLFLGFRKLDVVSLINDVQDQNHLAKSLTMSQHAGSKSAEINDKIREAKIDENRVATTDNRLRLSVIDENVTRLNMRLSNIETMLGASANALISYMENMRSPDGIPPIREDHLAAAREAVELFNIATYTQSEEERADQEWCRERRDAAIRSLRETTSRVNPEVVPEVMAKRQRMAPELTSDFSHPRSNWEKGATAVEKAEKSGKWKVVNIQCKKFANSNANKTGGCSGEPTPSTSKAAAKSKTKNKTPEAPEVPDDSEDELALTGYVSDFTSESGSDVSTIPPRKIPPRKAKSKGKVDSEVLRKAMAETQACLREKKLKEEERAKREEAEQKRKDEEERINKAEAEKARRAEEERARKAEIEAELARKAEEARQKEAARKRELEKAKRSEELKRKIEAKRKAEAERKAEDKRKSEERRKAEEKRLEEKRLLDEAIKTAEAMKAVRAETAKKTAIETQKRREATLAMEAKKAASRTSTNKDRVAEIRRSLVEKVKEKEAKKKSKSNPKTSYDGWEISSKRGSPATSAPRNEDDPHDNRGRKDEKIDKSKRKREQSKTPEPPAKRPNGQSNRKDRDDDEGANSSVSGSASASTTRRVLMVPRGESNDRSNNNHNKATQGNKRSRSYSGNSENRSPTPKASKYHISPTPGPSGRKTSNLIVQVDNIAADDYTPESIDKRRELIALLQDQTEQIAQTKQAINAETRAAAEQMHYEGVIRAVAKRESLENRERDLRDTLEERKLDLRTVLNRKRESMGGIPFDLDDDFEIKREIVDNTNETRYDNLNLKAASLETAIALSKVASPSVTGVTSIEGKDGETSKGFLIKSVTGEKRRREARASLDEALYGTQPVVLLETMSPEVIKAYSLQPSLEGCTELNDNVQERPSSPFFETSDEDEEKEDSDQENLQDEELTSGEPPEDPPGKRAVDRLTKLIEQLRYERQNPNNDHNDDKDDKDDDSSADSRLYIDTSAGSSITEGVNVGQVVDDEGSEAE